MKSRIEPKKVKIYDTVDANSLEVVIGQDDGVTCRIAYTLSYVAPLPENTVNTPTISRVAAKVLGQDSYLLKESDYASYSSATNRLQHALSYVATNLALTLIAD